MQIPLLQDLKGYSLNALRGDAVAAATVTVLTIPQAMAYALLAGVPVEYGLYSAIVSLIVYAVFGSSRQLAVGPAALISIIVITGLSVFSEPDSAEYLSLVIATTAVAGVILMLLSVFRLGFIVKFLSHAVLSGFISAAALIISISQLKHALGLDLERENSTIKSFMSIVESLSETNYIALALSLGGVLIMLVLKRVNKKIPGALIVTILSIALVYFLDLMNSGIAVIGDIPKGLPSFVMLNFDMSIILKVFPLALTIAIISFIESMAIAKMIAVDHKEYKISPDQELLSLGLVKFVVSLFQGFPTTGSFSRSSINDQSGAKTGVSSILVAVFVALSLFFLTPVLYYLPNAILAAIVIVSVIQLIDIQEMKNLWKTDRRDLFMLLITLLITFVFGITEGVLSGMAISLFLVLYKSTKPNIAVLGMLPGSKRNRCVNRYPVAVEHEGILLLRMDAQLYFANSEYFYDKIVNEVEKREGVKCVILDAAAIADIDSAGVHTLNSLLDYLANREITFLITKVRGPVRDMFEKTGLNEKIGIENQFLINNDAIDFCNLGARPSDIDDNYVSQTDVLSQ